MVRRSERRTVSLICHQLNGNNEFIEIYEFQTQLRLVQTFLFVTQGGMAVKSLHF